MAHRRIALVLAGAATLAATMVSPPAAAEELRTVVPQVRESPRRVDPLLVMTGAVLFAMPYTASIAIAGTSNLAADRWLVMPVIGPVGDLIQRSTCSVLGCRGIDLGAVALPLALDGIAQAAGAGILLFAVLRPSRPAPIRRAAVQVLPTSPAGGPGLSAVGTF